MPHSPPQKSGLYISGDFKEIGAVTPSFALSPNPNKMWLKTTTAMAPATPAAKQIAIRCNTVKSPACTFRLFSITFNAFSVIYLPQAEIGSAISQCCYAPLICFASEFMKTVGGDRMGNRGPPVFLLL